MLLFEFENSNGSTKELVALSQFLLSRADDTNAKNSISVAAFIKLAANMGISISPQQLVQMAQQEPLSNVIADVSDEQVTFKGSEDSAVTMSVDQARATVDQMAKRALK
jgi:hypothetical protein